MIVRLFEKDKCETINDQAFVYMGIEAWLPCWSCLPKTKEVILYELSRNYPISQIVGQDQTVLYVVNANTHTYSHSFIHSYIHTYRHASIRTYVRTYIHKYIQYMTHFGPITIRLTSLKFHLKLPYMKISPPRSLKLLEGWLSPSLAGAGGSAQVFRGQWKGQEAIPRSGEWMFESPLFGVFEAFVPTKLGGFMDHS